MSKIIRRVADFSSAESLSSLHNLTLSGKIDTSLAKIRLEKAELRIQNTQLMDAIVFDFQLSGMFVARVIMTNWEKYILTHSK